MSTHFIVVFLSHTNQDRPLSSLEPYSHSFFDDAFNQSTLLFMTFTLATFPSNSLSNLVDTYSFEGSQSMPLSYSTTLYFIATVASASSMFDFCPSLSKAVTLVIELLIPNFINISEVENGETCLTINTD